MFGTILNLSTWIVMDTTVKNVENFAEQRMLSISTNQDINIRFLLEILNIIRFKYNMILAFAYLYQGKA